jgi:hypothetical protein
MRSVGNLNCSACIDYLINAVGQGKDFQPQIGGNCDWKFFLRQYAIFKEKRFLWISFTSHLQSNYSIFFTLGQSSLLNFIVIKRFFDITKTFYTKIL